MRKLGKFLIATAALATTALGARAVFARRGDRLARAARYRFEQWNGVSYRLRGRRPDPDVTDNVLADRVRSSIGPLEACLDLPHVHVMVEDHTVLLHGDVASADEATTIEDAVRAISGVVGVESYLHVGLLPSDTRPSEGARHRPPSAALHELLSAVTAIGVPDARARSVVGVVLSALAEQVPAGELDHLMSHLPDDCRQLMRSPRRIGERATRTRTVSDLVARVLAVDRVPPERAERAARAVFAALRARVPEEAADIGAVLPEDLRHLWRDTPIR
ncbi:MAG: DUF2267 domain-containing protein [Acidimicrobiia bacterium]